MSATSTPSDSPLNTPIQPLHNPAQAAHVVVPQAPLGNVSSSNTALGMGAKALLSRKLPNHNPNYISPTDNMMTPCTQKLNATRKKQFAKGPKPVQLFPQQAQDDSARDDEDSSEIPHDGDANTLVHDDNNPF